MVPIVAVFADAPFLCSLANAVVRTERSRVGKRRIDLGNFDRFQ